MSTRSIRLVAVFTLLALLIALSPKADASPLGVGPVNDNFFSAQTLRGNTGMVVGSNVGATKEDWESDHADVPGGASVWYKWIAPLDSSMTFDTDGSDFDTILAVYVWPDRSRPLVPVAGNDDADPNTITSQVSFDARAGQTYYIVVDGYEGDSGDVVLNWAPAAGLSSQPKGSQSTSTTVSYQSLLNMLGKSKTDPEFVAFAGANACIYTPTNVGFLTFEFWKCLSKGMEIQPNSGGHIDSIRLYGQPAEGYSVYQDELPNGITWQDTRATVEQKLGRPDKTSVTSGQLYATYLAQSCVITYQTNAASAHMIEVVVELNPR